MTQLVENLPAMQETWVRSLVLEDPLEKEKTTHSSILTWTVHRVTKSWTRLTFTFIKYLLPNLRDTKGSLVLSREQRYLSPCFEQITDIPITCVFIKIAFPIGNAKLLHWNIVCKIISLRKSYHPGLHFSQNIVYINWGATYTFNSVLAKVTYSLIFWREKIA